MVVEPDAAMQETDQEPGGEREGDVGIPGLNDSFEFAGRRLHVQTERMMRPTPHIVTQVFGAGRVLLSRTCEAPLMNDAGGCNLLRELMHAQHSQVIRDLSRKQESIQGPRQGGGK